LSYEGLDAARHVPGHEKIPIGGHEIPHHEP
jgi:hypothetical protein